jgi:hypothetical protein
METEKPAIATLHEVEFVQIYPQGNHHLHLTHLLKYFWTSNNSHPLQK